MRVMIVTDAWQPQVNGVARTYEWLSRRLSSHVDLSMLTPEHFPRMPMPTYPEIELALAWPKTVAETITSNQPEIVHIATEGPLGLWARQHCRAANIPFTTCYHTRYPEYVARRFRIPLRWTYSALRRFHSAAARTLVATKGLAQELKQHGFARVIPWRRGIDVSLFANGPIATLDLPRPIFLYVGRVAVEKNIDDFLKLDLPGSKIVVGDGPERQRLQAIYPDAHFLGALHGEALGSVYRAADCFVFPSRTDTYGLVMAEALAAGTPVACYPSSGAKEIMGTANCGVMSDDLRTAALAALHSPRSLCAEVGRSHSLEASADNFLAILRDVMKNHAASGSRWGRFA